MSNNSYKKKKVHINNPANNVNHDTTEEVIEEEIVENEQPETEEENYTFEEYQHMYRVRLEWERHDTQIFASPDKDEALKAAAEHQGYKVYIDDDGELYYDPWDPANIVEEEVRTLDDKFIIIPIEGMKVELLNCPLFSSVNAKNPLRKISGTFYYYDYSVTKGRAKITNVDVKNVIKKDPKMILGYIDVR